MSSARVALATLLTAFAGTALAEESAAERFGLRTARGEKMVISSDALEAVTSGGVDRVIFSKSVKASQGDFTVFCNWLEAVYPKGGGGSPNTITARGNVRIRQAGNEARCAEAVVDTRAQTAECRSADGRRAELLRDNGVMRADKIFFDLDKGLVRALGNTVIEVTPRKEPVE